MALHNKDASYQASDTIGGACAAGNIIYLVAHDLLLRVSLFSGKVGVLTSRKQHRMKPSALKKGCCIKRPSCVYMQGFLAVYVHHTFILTVFSLSREIVWLPRPSRSTLARVRRRRESRESGVSIT